MDAAPILICYDGSDGAKHAIEAAAGLLGGHPAVVLAVGPPLTPEESYAALGPMTPSFQELNEQQALDRAKEGADLAQSAGFAAEARADVAAPTWEGVVQAVDAAYEARRVSRQTEPASSRTIAIGSSHQALTPTCVRR
jgi:hypothetical protein